jgi:hypothetical protein
LKIGFITITVLALAIVGAAALVPRGNIDSDYDSMHDAKESGAIERGWIPNWLPQSAKRIHQTHHPSSNTWFIALEYGEVDREWFAKPCIRSEGSPPKNPNPRVGWWFNSRRGEEAWRSLTFFTCSSPNTGHELTLAIDRNSRSAFLWTNAR